MIDGRTYRPWFFCGRKTRVYSYLISAKYYTASCSRLRAHSHRHCRYSLRAGVKEEHSTPTDRQSVKTANVHHCRTTCADVFMCHIGVEANDTMIEIRMVQQSDEVCSPYLILNGNYWFIQNSHFARTSCSIRIQFHCHLSWFWFMRLEKWNRQSALWMVLVCVRKNISKKRRKMYIRCGAANRQISSTLHPVYAVFIKLCFTTSVINDECKLGAASVFPFLRSKRENKLDIGMPGSGWWGVVQIHANFFSSFLRINRYSSDTNAPWCDESNMVLRQVAERSNSTKYALIASDFSDSTFDFQTAYGIDRQYLHHIRNTVI